MRGARVRSIDGAAGGSTASVAEPFHEVVRRQRGGTLAGPQPQTSPRVAAERAKVLAAFGSAPVAQPKKSGPYPGFAVGGHHPLIRHHPVAPLLEKGGPAEVDDRRVFDIVSAQYDDSLAKGRRLWASLLDHLIRYQTDRAALVQELTAKRQEYRQRWEQEYRSERRAGRVLTEGLPPARGDAPRVAPRGYKNRMDLDANTIVAEGNYANDDPARLAGRGLNNSEILWQQYLGEVRARHGGAADAEDRTAQKMAELGTIERMNLQNPVVQKVAYFCYPDGQYWNSARQWEPQDEEFHALLGTPNVAAAVHLLCDHVDELGGKTIARIVTTADQCIRIVFGPAPGAAALKRSLLQFSPMLWSMRFLPSTDLGRDNPLM